jgi:hypothetical protein
MSGGQKFSCPERAQVYQERYATSLNSSDLICYQQALEREMSGGQKFSCPNSAKFYEEAYIKSTNSSDLVCYQQALEREFGL